MQSSAWRAEPSHLCLGIDTRSSIRILLRRSGRAAPLRSQTDAAGTWRATQGASTRSSGRRGAGSTRRRSQLRTELPASCAVTTARRRAQRAVACRSVLDLRRGTACARRKLRARPLAHGLQLIGSGINRAHLRGLCLFAHGLRAYEPLRASAAPPEECARSVTDRSGRTLQALRLWRTTRLLPPTPTLVVGMTGEPLLESPGPVQSLSHFSSLARNYDLADAKCNQIDLANKAMLPSGTFTAVSKPGCRVVIFPEREPFTPRVEHCAAELTNAGCIGLIFAAMYNLAWRGRGTAFDDEGVDLSLDLGVHHYIITLGTDQIDALYTFAAVLARYNKAQWYASSPGMLEPRDELARDLADHVFEHPERLGRLLGQAVGRELPDRKGVNMPMPGGSGYQLHRAMLADTPKNRRNMQVYFLNAGLNLKEAVFQGVRCSVSVETVTRPHSRNVPCAMHLQRGSPTEPISLAREALRMMTQSVTSTPSVPHDSRSGS